MKFKVKVYKTVHPVVRPATIYGAQTWYTTKNEEKRLDLMWMLRWMWGVTHTKIKKPHRFEDQ